MPNVMAALPNIGGALCSTPQSLADAHYWSALHNAANTRSRLKFAGVPQTRQQIPGVSRPKFTILSGHVEEVLLFNSFFPIVDTCLSCENVAEWRIFGDFLRPIRILSIFRAVRHPVRQS